MGIGSLQKRSKKITTLSIDSEKFSVEILEYPFREGVEVRSVVRGKQLSFSDRGLGLEEAIRLLKEEIVKIIAS